MTTKAKPRKRRERVERNLYRRVDAAGKTIYEIGFRDSTGRQRFKTAGRKISAARAERDSILGHKGKGGHVEPNPRLTFTEAADRWLAEQVSGLRPSTRDGYTNAIDRHLRPRWRRRRLDSISVSDAALLVRELGEEGKAEWTIAGVLKAARRVFKFARRHLHWHGSSPIDALENGELPKVSEAPRRRVFEGTELAETLAAATVQMRPLFALYAITGCRESEALGLHWEDVDLADLDAASIHFAWQLGRDGERYQLKTDESQRSVEIPSQLAAMLAELKAASPHSKPGSFVFATRSGRAISQRNVHRGLRRAMRLAKTEDGKPTFPTMNLKDSEGKALPVPRGSVPTVHGLRHTAASEAIAAGDSAEEVSWLLGHKSSVVTRAVYIRELRTAERSIERREKLTTRYGSLLEAANRSEAPQDQNGTNGEVVDLATKRSASQ